MRKSPQDKFTVAAKKRLIEERLTVTALAQSLGFARNTVSMALNHPILPTVRRRIASRLRISEAA